ncbi:hypothetical protein D9758_009163 [Tetrapyrgos nigripes]|uniref:Uncharacterized protein n=1 Tax=Tetrapyrgos nigripes TaxID=182062 RepID=A0A8H5LKD2_9AGAR|nr:hypothetical protein D9758_009163 [Tetrapyrgos nigripes]
MPRVGCGQTTQPWHVYAEEPRPIPFSSCSPDVTSGHKSPLTLFYLFDNSLDDSMLDMDLFSSNCKVIAQSSDIINRLLTYIYTKLPRRAEGTLHGLQACRVAGGAPTDNCHLQFFTHETSRSLAWSLKVLTNTRTFGKLMDHAAEHYRVSQVPTSDHVQRFRPVWTWSHNSLTSWRCCPLSPAKCPQDRYSDTTQMSLRYSASGSNSFPVALSEPLELCYITSFAS